jgi:hypothetical protein
MPPPSLRIVRRPKGRTAKKTSLDSLVAASRPVLDVAAEFKSSMGRHDSWQELAWEMYDRVGELRYYVGWRAGSCSRVKLMASSVDEETGKPSGDLPDDNEGQRVREIVRSIAGGALGQTQLIKRAVEGLSVSGETWIATLDTGEKDVEGNPQMRWCVLSKDEVRSTAGGVIDIDLPSGDRHEFNPSSDSIIRVWIPYPRKAADPDSPVRAAMDSLQEIVRTTKTIANASKSRLIGNGIVFLPQEMSLPATQGPMGGFDSDDPEDILALSGTPAVKQLQELLWQVATTAYDDADSMAALIPMFATVPAEQIQKVQHLKFDNQVTQVAIQTRNDAISRLAMALDISPERLLGLGSSTNHWTAWQITDEDVQLHIAPVVELICQALTENVLSKVLMDEGIDPRKYVIWYDASGLTTDPDKTNAATSAFTNGAINGEAFRDYLGLDASAGYDFDTMDGWKLWARDIVGRQPQFAPVFAHLLGPGSQELPLIIDPTMSGGTGPPTPQEIAQPQQQKAVPGSPNKKPQTEQSSKQDNRAGVSQQAAAALVPSLELRMVEQLLLHKALELAGKRRRKRDDYARLRDVPMHETHRYMPPVAGEDVAALVSGWDTALVDEAIQMLPIDTEELRMRVYATIKRELTAPLVDVAHD